MNQNKSGMVVAIQQGLSLPIKFIGEKPDGLQPFDARRFAGIVWRILTGPTCDIGATGTIWYGAPMKALVLNAEQYITDANGKRVGVLLNVQTYDRLREAEEELADIRAYDAARPKVRAELKAGQTGSLADYRTTRNSHRK